MTHNHTATTSKTVNDGHTAGHAGQNDNGDHSHNMHKDAEAKGQPASVHEKAGIHKEVSADPKFKDHNMHKDAEAKGHSASVHEKAGTHKEVCGDPKCSCHDMKNDGVMKSSHAPGHDKTGSHKDVSAEPKSGDHNMHTDAGMKSDHTSGHEKTRTPKDAPADAKLAAHNLKEIHQQITIALAKAKFPVKTSADLMSAFPNGASSKCHSGDLKMTAGEAGKLLKATDFPFVNAKAVADVIVQRASL